MGSRSAAPNEEGRFQRSSSPKRAEQLKHFVKMGSKNFFFLILLVVASECFRTVKLGGKDCTFKGEKVCNGGVVKEIGKSLVKVCTDGKVKLKPRKQVGEGYALLGRDTGPGKDCVWYERLSVTETWWKTSSDGGSA